MRYEVAHVRRDHDADRLWQDDPADDRGIRHADGARRLLLAMVDRLQAGDAPFYWLTHPESRAWIDARHRTIESSGPPFSDFGAAT